MVGQGCLGGGLLRVWIEALLLVGLRAVAAETGAGELRLELGLERSWLLGLRCGLEVLVLAEGVGGLGW